METIFWYDLETFGVNPSRDRIAQFAGIRTDLNLQAVDEPLELFCRQAADYLPDPGSCLVTGITPQQCQARGLPEAAFADAILRAVGRPATCVAGYNNIRFDDEFLRYLLYRNFYDPYGREYQQGNSRWDLLDVMRAAHLLRPKGMEWPRRPDGLPSFKLEEITRANGIAHADAHDALADVRATIAVAGLLRQAQPRLFDYLFKNRGKRAVRPLLDVRAGEPVLHVSGMIGAERGNASLFLPIVEHPVNGNAVICYDLREDPAPLLELDPAEIRRRVFSPAEDLGGVARIPLKEIHANRCAIVMPARWVDDRIADRMRLDRAACDRHLARLAGHGDLSAAVRDVFLREPLPPSDPEQALYQGFIPDSDRRLCTQLLDCPPEQWLDHTWPFHDPRLQALLPRSLGRSYPEHLRGDALEAWRAHCHKQLHCPGPGGRGIEAFERALGKAREQATTPAEQAILDEVAAWARVLAA